MLLWLWLWDARLFSRKTGLICKSPVSVFVFWSLLMIRQGLFQIFMACLGHPALLTPLRWSHWDHYTHALEAPWLPSVSTFLFPTFLFLSWLPSWSLRNRCPISFPNTTLSAQPTSRLALLSLKPPHLPYSTSQHLSRPLLLLSQPANILISFV